MHRARVDRPEEIVALVGDEMKADTHVTYHTTRPLVGSYTASSPFPLPHPAIQGILRAERKGKFLAFTVAADT
jgi:hypothetical protein